MIHFFPNSQTKFKAYAAFTLVEMLVATAVFLVLIVLFVHLVTSTSAIVIHDNNKMASLGDVRQALNRFSMDWLSRTRRADLDWIITNPGATNASITLLSLINVADGTRRLAAVSYRINYGRYGLERGVLGYNWTNGGGKPSLIFTNSSASNSATFPVVPSDADYEILAPTVFRICISYLDTATGKWTVTPPGSPQISLSSTNLGAVSVTVASLDGVDRVILSTNQLGNLSTALGDIQGAQDPKMVWIQKLNAPGFAATAGVPSRAASSVHIYQKVFYIKD